MQYRDQIGPEARHRFYADNQIPKPTLLVWVEPFCEFVLFRPIFIMFLVAEFWLLFNISQNKAVILAGSEMPILNDEFGYSIARVNEILRGYRFGLYHTYREIMLFNVLHPFVYSSLLMALIWGLSVSWRWRWLVFPAAFVGLFDYGESIFIAEMMNNALPVNADPAIAGNILSLCKHSLFQVMMVAIAVLILRRLWAEIQIVRDL